MEEIHGNMYVFVLSCTKTCMFLCFHVQKHACSCVFMYKTCMFLCFHVQKHTDLTMRTLVERARTGQGGKCPAPNESLVHIIHDKLHLYLGCHFRLWSQLQQPASKGSRHLEVLQLQWTEQKMYTYSKHKLPPVRYRGDLFNYVHYIYTNIIAFQYFLHVYALGLHLSKVCTCVYNIIPYSAG